MAYADWTTARLVERWAAIESQLDNLVRLSMPYLSAEATRAMTDIFAELARRETAAANGDDDDDPPLVGF